MLTDLKPSLVECPGSIPNPLPSFKQGTDGGVELPSLAGGQARVVIRTCGYQGSQGGHYLELLEGVEMGVAIVQPNLGKWRNMR